MQPAEFIYMLFLFLNITCALKFISSLYYGDYNRGKTLLFFSVPIRKSIERISYCDGEQRAITGVDTLVVIGIFFCYLLK